MLIFSLSFSWLLFFDNVTGVAEIFAVVTVRDFAYVTTIANQIFFDDVTANPKNLEGKAVGEIEGGKRQRFLMWFWESDTVSYAGGNNTRVPEKKTDKRTDGERRRYLAR